MDIQYAILGLLTWRSFSGYDLKKIISESELFYWSGNNNQIYYSLVRLHQDGWVDLHVQPQENLPNKKIYSITAAGRAALRQWTLADPELPELRNPFLIQLAWADQLSDEELDGLLARYEHEIEVQLRMRQVRLTRPAEAPHSPRAGLLWRKITENLIGVDQAELEWVRQLRAELSRNP